MQMAKVVAVTKVFKSLADVEAKLSLGRSDDAGFFPEWRLPLSNLTTAERDRLSLIRQRLLYHRSGGDLLEGAVMLLVASPLLELAGFYDPPFQLKSEVSVDISVDDGEEILRGRIDALILQQNFWVLVVEAKKTTISTRSALPQTLAYMMANHQLDERPTFGLMTNGDDVLFVKLAALQPSTPEGSSSKENLYSLSRTFSLYTVPEELETVLQVMKNIGDASAPNDFPSS